MRMAVKRLASEIFNAAAMGCRQAATMANSPAKTASSPAKTALNRRSDSFFMFVILIPSGFDLHSLFIQLLSLAPVQRRLVHRATVIASKAKVLITTAPADAAQKKERLAAREGPTNGAANNTLPGNKNNQVTSRRNGSWKYAASKAADIPVNCTSKKIHTYLRFTTAPNAAPCVHSLTNRDSHTFGSENTPLNGGGI